jgi:hypothetical protein
MRGGAGSGAGRRSYMVVRPRLAEPPKGACRSVGCRGLRHAQPLHAGSTLGAWLAGAALVVETEPQVTGPRRAILVGRAAPRGAGSIEAEPRTAVGVPSALFSTRPGTPLAIARARDEETDTPDAASVVGSACGFVVTEAAAARRAFTAAACAFDASCLTAAIAVGGTAPGFAVTVDTRLTGRAGILRIAPRCFGRRF